MTEFGPEALLLHAFDDASNKITKSVVTLAANRTTTDIPVINHLGETVAIATCSIEDAEEARKWSWRLNAGGYVSCVQRPPGLSKMHQMVIDSQGILVPPKHVIDHIDHNPLNNARSNLRVATYSLNAQNRAKGTGTTSTYKGVSFHSQRKTWVAAFGQVHLGTFLTEESAAYAYDTFVIDKYGPGVGMINGVPQPTEDHKCKPRPRKNNYPIGVGKTKTKWSATNVREWLGTFDTMEEASEAVQNSRAKTEKINEDAFLAQPVTFNEDHIAVIKTSKDEHILVDVDDWYTLMRHSWYVSEVGNAAASVNGCTTTMHHFLMPLNGSPAIDHINRNPLDNRKTNLRRASCSLNAHNRTKKPGSTSMYYGVCFSQNKFCVQIGKDYVKYTGGCYESEIVAAWVFDCIAKELYKDQAKLNNVAKPDGWIYDSVQRKGISSRIRKRSGSASPFHGVALKGTRYAVELFEDRKRHFFGSYNLETVAAWTADQARVFLFGKDKAESHMNDIANPEGWFFDEQTSRAKYTSPDEDNSINTPDNESESEDASDKSDIENENDSEERPSKRLKASPIDCP